MSNFWTAEDKIPISQTKVSVPAQHGLQYSPGQKCEFHLPQGINFFQPGESYLNLGVKIQKDPVNDPTKLQLDAEIGAHVLIKDIRIYSGGAGRILLEEYQNYNVLCALKYDYETNDTLKAKRALTEGATVYSEKDRNDHGVEYSMQNNNQENPYFKANDGSASYSTAFTDNQYTEVKALLQLNTGIFSNKKIFPIGMTEGLVVEIIFEDARRVFRTLDQTARYRHLATNPFFMSSNGTTDTAAPAKPNEAPQFPAAANASAFTEFWVRRDNSQGWGANVDSFPFASMMKSGGAMNYDFLSGTNYKISQLASERVANLRLPLSQSRAKSVLCIPTDASSSGTKELLEAKSTYITHYDLFSDDTTRTWNANHSSRTGLVGCQDQLTAYQLFYDGKLNPNRKVFCDKIATKNSVDSQPLIELEKGLQMGGIMPFSFKKFRENFAIGRALSLQNGVYDTRGTDFNLQAPPLIDKLWNCWCMHLRRIVISGDGIALQV